MTLQEKSELVRLLNLYQADLLNLCLLYTSDAADEL